MKDDDRHKESSYFRYWNVNLYGWTTSQKLPVRFQ